MATTFTLFTIPETKTKLKISAAEIIEKFSRHKIAVKAGKSRYVTFIRKSPIYLKPLETKIMQYYKKYYPSIRISHIMLIPRTYTDSLPEHYTLSLGNKSFRHSRGTFFIRSDKNQKIFFDYRLDADIDVIYTIRPLERKTELTRFNTTIQTLPFEKLKAVPLTSIQTHRYRLKHRIKADRPVAIRDVESSPMIKRGGKLAVSMHSGGLVIEFSAIALEDGALHDIISIRKHDGQRLKARVTGLNNAEIE